MTTKPSFQVKSSVDEYKQEADCVGWMCSKCGWNNLTTEDLSTLGAEVLILTTP
jgi:hypothetical protein